MLRRALAFALPLGIAAQALAETEGSREVEALFEKFVEAYNRKDATALAAAVHGGRHPGAAGRDPIGAASHPAGLQGAVRPGRRRADG